MHADFNRLVANVGQLGGDHWTFIEFNDRHGIGRICIIAGGGFVNGGVGEYFAFPAE